MSFIQLPDIKMFYRVVILEKEVQVIDPNLPAIIVLHGGPGIVDHQIEYNAWRKFSKLTAQIIFLDQRGNGKTDDGDPRLWNLKQCGLDIKNFCEKAGIIKPIIAGVSWGGYVAMSYATQFPNHPRGLILCNTEAKVDLAAKKKAYCTAFESLGFSHTMTPYNELATVVDNELMAKIGSIACEYDRNPSDENFSRFIKYCVPLFSRIPFELLPPSRINMAMRKKFIAEESLDMDFRLKLASVQCPVLQIAGDRDPTHPYICAEETARCFPHGSFVLLPDAGTPVYQDQPIGFETHITSFIEQLIEDNK